MSLVFEASASVWGTSVLGASVGVLPSVTFNFMWYFVTFSKHNSKCQLSTGQLVSNTDVAGHKTLSPLPLEIQSPLFHTWIPTLHWMTGEPEGFAVAFCVCFKKKLIYLFLDWLFSETFWTLLSFPSPLLNVSAGMLWISKTQASRF